MTFVAVDRAGKLPEISVDIDFTNDPTNPSRVWTDVTSDVRAISYVRGGRNHELQRTEAGTLSATLNNRAGDYDPTNASSPHYPGVKRMRWMRVRARWAGVTYPRWQGLIESWRQEWPGLGMDAIVDVRAVDAFKVLNLFDLDGFSYAAARTDQRVTSVVTDAGLPVSVDTGRSSIVAAGPFSSGSSALSHLLQVEETENGLVYANEDGTIIFESRHYRALNSVSADATVGDTGSTIRYRTGSLDLDDSDIWNIATVTPDGGSPETATDATSSTEHYERTLTRGILSNSQAEAADAARYLVNRYGDPGSRIPGVTLIGVQNPTNWPTILGLGNSDRITWQRSADANAISTDAYIERVADTVTVGTGWDVTLSLSPADDQTGWILGHAVYSIVGQTTIPVY